ncbi:MAG TPA: PorP/SprF family type IX secretion system membrane protein [Eudoraea sp.]|nr:PorP/SprF family type IX secretion system membrane protein [Eudoraea sp.]
MLKHRLLFFVLFAISALQSQDVLLPPDFRQHNLTEYNSSFLSPVFALDRNNPESLALWSRWQWQSIDADPTTLLLNYTRRLNTESVAGVGFFQNNTGIFLHSGGALNYAFALELKSNAQIAFGINLFGYTRKLAAENFQPDPNIILPLLPESNDFILRLAPSLRFKLDMFSIGIVAENLMDYNFSTKEKDTGPTEKVYIGLASYQFPVSVFGSSESSFIQPTVYLKTLPNFDNQFGFTALFSTPKFWVQTGLNNFYGLSAGIGGRFFKKFSIGALMEFGTSQKVDGTDPTIEFMTSYHLGPNDVRRKVIGFDEEEEVEELPLITEKEEVEEGPASRKEERKLEREARLAEKQQKQEVEAMALEQEKLAKAEEQSREKWRDCVVNRQKETNLAEAERLAQLRRDSIAQSQRRIRLAENAEKAALKTKDSLDAIQRQELALAQIQARQRVRDSIEGVQKEQDLARALAAQKSRDSIAAVREQEAIATAQKEEARQLAAQKTRDSLAAIRERERLAAVERERRQRENDSIAEAAVAQAAVEKQKDSLAPVVDEVKPAEGEKYEETATEDGLEPGFYLIANVFGTKKYFESFMATLQGRGLAPKSFFRSLNKYNYVYLQRYNSMAEARKARDSKFNGRYTGNTWIFRVVPE